MRALASTLLKVKRQLENFQGEIVLNWWQLFSQICRYAQFPASRPLKTIWRLPGNNPARDTTICRKQGNRLYTLRCGDLWIELGDTMRSVSEPPKMPQMGLRIGLCRWNSDSSQSVIEIREKKPQSPTVRSSCDHPARKTLIYSSAVSCCRGVCAHRNDPVDPKCSSLPDEAREFCPIQEETTVSPAVSNRPTRMRRFCWSISTTLFGPEGNDLELAHRNSQASVHLRLFVWLWIPLEQSCRGRAHLAICDEFEAQSTKNTTGSWPVLTKRSLSLCLCAGQYLWCRIWPWLLAVQVTNQRRMNC